MDRVLTVQGKEKAMFIATGETCQVLLLNNTGNQLWNGIPLRNGRVVSHRGFARQITCRVVEG